MCDPVTIFLLATGASVISDVQNLSEQANIADENARIAEEAARKNAAIERKESSRLKAAQRVSFLSSGVTFAGTPEQVLADTAQEEELNALAILHSGQIDAQAHRASAKALRKRRIGVVLGGIGTGGAALI